MTNLIFRDIIAILKMRNPKRCQMKILQITIFSTLLVLASCKKNQESSSSKDSSQPLIFLHYWSDELGTGIDTMMQAFSSTNKGYLIKTTGFDHESYKVSIKVMLAGGNPPDLFSYWAGARTTALIEKEYLEPLSDVWSAESIDSKVSKMVANACKYNNIPYVIPVTQHYVAFFYNKKLFSKMGLEEPKTWEEFSAVCDSFLRSGITPIDLGARDLWPAQFWFDYLLLRTAGPAFRDSLMNGTAKYSDSRVIESFSIWKNMIDKGYFKSDAATKDWAEAGRSVALGDAPMTLMGTWIIGMFDNQYNLKQGIDYDYFSFPSITQNIPSCALGPIDGILLPKASNIKKSKEVIATFAQTDVQRAMCVGSGALSPCISVIPEEKAVVQKRIHKELQTIDYWAFNYDLAANPEVSELGLKLFGQFLSKPQSYEQLLMELQSKIDSAK